MFQTERALFETERIVTLDRMMAFWRGCDDAYSYSSINALTRLMLRMALATANASDVGESDSDVKMRVGSGTISTAPIAVK